MPPGLLTLKDEEELDRYLELLFADIRFKEWKIDKEWLRRQLADSSYPISFDKILLSCLKNYFQHDYCHWVHKAGFYIECMEQARELFPCAKHVYIQRDPRAIFSSQKNSKSLYSDRQMGESVVAFAIRYKIRARLIRLYENDADFFLATYEDLIASPEKNMGRLLQFLMVKCTAKTVEDGYVDKIPGNQQALHTNVNSEPILANADKWRSGLNYAEILFLQTVLRRELKSYNYESVRPKHTTMAGLVQYLKLLAHYAASSILRVLKRRHQHN